VVDAPPNLRGEPVAWATINNLHVLRWLPKTEREGEPAFVRIVRAAISVPLFCHSPYDSFKIAPKGRHTQLRFSEPACQQAASQGANYLEHMEMK
jgi:hypothetical protein